jgi:DNA-binding NarL/FixJ family response regulator
VNQLLKLLIVDDHPVVREGLSAVISLEPDLAVVAGASTAAEAIDLISDLQPDVVIVDITLPGRNGIELIKDILKISPDSRIVVYTMHDMKTYADRAFKAGALGYVMKEKGASRVVEAIRHVVRGDRFLCVEIPPDRPDDRLKGKSLNPDNLSIEKLSNRELEVFELVGSGMNSTEIGEKLILSPKTANAHKMNIQGKLGLGSARELLMAATRWVDRH